MSRNTRGRVSIERLDWLQVKDQSINNQESKVFLSSLRPLLGTWELLQLSNKTETKFQRVKICWRHLLLTLSLPPHA